MSFKRNTMIVFSVFFLIIFLFVWYLVHYYSSGPKWPPLVSKCPDYWDVSGNSCYNRFGLGLSSFTNSEGTNEVCYDTDKKKSFVDPIYTGIVGDCEKKKWSNNCGVQWDGITNMTPCDASEPKSLLGAMHEN